MRRDALLAPLELSLMKEPQPRGQEGNAGCGLLYFWREWCLCSRLVVVFQEASHLVLIVQPRVEMLANGPGVPLAQAVVQSFVIGVVESLLLQRPFQVPVDL